MSRFLLPYGWFGLLILGLSGWLLSQGNVLVGTWFTPIMWTGYILFIDNIVHGRTGKSLIRSSRAQLPVILILSIGSWLIFEGYNVLIQNWHYINLPEKRWVRYTGYAWSFATITPGILLTSDLLKSFDLFSSARIRPVRIGQKVIVGVAIVSALLSVYPLLFSNKYLFPLVWISFIFLADPLTYLLDGRSLISDLIRGRLSTICQLLMAGIICGFLWEFWNYWAVAKWIYSVPYFPEIKIFEMPLAGYLGFPLFAIECFVLFQLFKVLLEKIGISLRYEA